MRTWRQRSVDFANSAAPSNVWYDIYYDWDLIDASFTAQYGIRLRSDEDMSWGEFTSLLAGLGPDTPLGRIVAIRAETDKDTLKRFTSDQHRIRAEWRSFLSDTLNNSKNAEDMTRSFQEMCKAAFS